MVSPAVRIIRDGGTPEAENRYLRKTSIEAAGWLEAVRSPTISLAHIVARLSAVDEWIGEKLEVSRGWGPVIGACMGNVISGAVAGLAC